MSRSRRLVTSAARRLSPPRDDAAMRLMRAGRDLVTGRAAPKPAVAKPAAPATTAGQAPAVRLFAAPGNYSSPIVDVNELTGNGSDIDGQVELPGIDLDIARHAAVWAAWSPHLQRWQTGAGEGRRYSTENNRMFGPLSAALLAGAIGAIAPRRYVEIGSGFSSAVLLDINDEWRREDPIELTFIEPYPQRLESILREGDRDICTIIVDKVQAVDLAVFDTLQPGDVLFIDSSHVAKSGSDLLRELFDILPRLPVGVFVHFHDIPYPFDYPKNWLFEQNRSWNETYFLRSFLMYNEQFKVHFWTDFFARFGADTTPAESFAPLRGNRPTSIWIERVAR